MYAFCIYFWKNKAMMTCNRSSLTKKRNYQHLWGSHSKQEKKSLKFFFCNSFPPYLLTKNVHKKKTWCVCFLASKKNILLLANADLWRVMYVRNGWCWIKAFFEIFRRKVSLTTSCNLWKKDAYLAVAKNCNLTQKTKANWLLRLRKLVKAC